MSDSPVGGLSLPEFERIAATHTQTCGECRHWTPEPDWEREIRGWGTCGRVVHGFWQYQEDAVPSGHFACNAPAPADTPAAFTMDGSDYMSSLSTNLLFGCVLFEARKDGL